MNEEVKLTKAWDVHASFPFWFIRIGGMEVTVSYEQLVALNKLMKKSLNGVGMPEIGDMNVRRSIVDEQFIAEWREKAK